MNPSQVPFLVREEVTSLIMKRLEALEKGYRQNVGLVGLPGSGKTFFLSRIFQNIAAHPQFIPIYIYADAIDFDHLVDRWAGALLTGLFLSQGVQPPQTFHSLLLAADPIIPKTTDRIRYIKKNMRREKTVLLCKELFSLSDCLAHETGKKLILMIDEFDQLEALGVSDPFNLLGKEIMVQKNTLYLVASSSPAKAKEIFKEKLSMLFGNFEVLDIAAFGFAETSNYLESRFPDLDFNLGQKEFLIRLTDGKPDYLEIILDQLQNRINHHAVSETSFIKNTNGTLPTDYLIEAIHRELMPSTGRLSSIFQKKIDSCRQLGKDAPAYFRVLVAMSHGRARVNAIASAIERKIHDTKKILARLEAKDLIMRRGSFYLLEDPLFRFWLREVFEKENHHYVPDQMPLQEECLASLKRDYQNAQSGEGKAFARQLEMLLKEFRNDSFEIQGRKIQCPQFSEINVRTLGPASTVLIAKSSKVKWHCQLHEEKISEEEVGLFLEELKKYRKKPQQRILIMLRGIEQNAKLMAQEAGMQLWDLRMVNTLLDLFNIPKIILLPEKEIHGPHVGAVAQSVYSA